MGTKVVLIFLKYGISSYTDLKFSLRYFYKPYFLLLYVFLMQNMKKAFW